MARDIFIQLVPARILAAVRRSVLLDQIANSWRPALEQVWAFLQQHPGLRPDGHNIFLYHHPANMQSPMDVDFGVQVTRPFERTGEVFSTEIPAGRVATAQHVAPYQRLGDTHKAIHAWASANKISFSGKSWEIYGDSMEDAAKLETQVEYLLS